MKGEDKAIIDSNDYYQRTTILTRFLRKLKLDEIPQLINILEGNIGHKHHQELKELVSEYPAIKDKIFIGDLSEFTKGDIM